MRVLVAADRPNDREQYRIAALAAGLVCDKSDCGETSQLAARMAREPVGRVVLVGLGDIPEAGLDALSRAAAVADTVAVAVGPMADAELVQRAMTAGARRYLDADRLAEQLPVALATLGNEGSVALSRGKVVAVVSAQPGSGVTTVATALAFTLAEEKAGSVALAELGTGVPELALTLNVAPVNSLGEFIGLSQEADGKMARAAAVEHKGGVAVLAYKAETLAPQAVSADEARRLATVLRAAFDWVVLDLGHGAGDGNGEFLAHADRVVVVTRQDVPAVRLTRRMVGRLGVAPADRLLVVANRYGQAGHMAWKKVEEALKVPVKEWIPDDPSGVNAALTAGEPLTVVARGSGVVKSARSLAKEMTKQLAGRAK
jgi:pilus assembly protein CpaE